MKNDPQQSPLWALSEHGHITGVKGLKLQYCRVPASTTVAFQGTIVLCSGRGESGLKYWELVTQLHQQGFALALWDHRGQGLSARLLADSQIGHVQHFNDYVADMAIFMREQVLPHTAAPHYLLGHSMGGAISCLYLQQYPHHFAKAFLCAPMLGIHLPAPRAVIRPLLALWQRWRPTGYAIGGQAYAPKPFANNPYTSDTARYQWQQALLQQYPQIQVGSPSVHWIQQAIDTCDRLASISLTTPVMIAIGECDSIVDNQAIHAFAAVNNMPVYAVPQGRHELLLEQDSLRTPLLQQLLHWYTPIAMSDICDAS